MDSRETINLIPLSQLIEALTFNSFDLNYHKNNYYSTNRIIDR